MNKKILLIMGTVILIVCGIFTINVFANNDNLEVYIENIIEKKLISVSSYKSEEAYHISFDIDNETLANLYIKNDWRKIESLLNEDAYVCEPVYIKMPEKTSKVKYILNKKEHNAEIIQKDGDIYAKYNTPILKKQYERFVPQINQKYEMQIIAIDENDTELMNKNIGINIQFAGNEKTGVFLGSKECILSGLGDTFWQECGLYLNENYVGCHLEILTEKRLTNDYIDVEGIGRFIYEGYNDDNEFGEKRYKYSYEIKDNKLNEEETLKRYCIVTEDVNGNKEINIVDIFSEQQEIEEGAKLSNTISNNIITFKEQNKYLDYTGEITIDKSLINDDKTLDYFNKNEKLEENLYIKIMGASTINTDKCFYKIKNKNKLSDLQKLHILKKGENGYVEGETWGAIPIILLEQKDYQVNCTDNIDKVNQIRLYLNTERELINDDSFNQSYEFKIITKNENIFKPSVIKASDFTKTSLGYKTDITISYGTQLKTPKILYICNLRNGGQSYFVTDVLGGKETTTQLVVDNSKIENIEIWLMDGEIDFSGDAFSGVKADILELSIPN